MSESIIRKDLILGNIQNLFNTFHDHNIIYCHWKNNPDHLIKSFTGDSDVDILFNVSQKNEIVSVLENLGYKIFILPNKAVESDIVDFFMVDPLSGKLIHLHAHFRFTFGPRYAKNYQFGLEEFILKNRIYIKKYNVYGTSPAMQLILFYVNESLKFRKRDKLKLLIFNSLKQSEKLKLELKWLLNNADFKELQNLFSSIFNNNSELLKLIQSPYTLGNLIKFGSLLKKDFNLKKIDPPIKSVLKSWKNEIQVNFTKTRHTFYKPVVRKRINPRGGKVIAIIGADGSGKSTVTRDLRSTFENKIGTYFIYFGRGDGNISLARKFLLGFKGLFSDKSKKSDVKLKTKVKHDQSNKKNKIHFIIKTYKIIEALLVAQEKRTNINRMNKAREKGIIVLCDRFPQNQIIGYNDGPLLNDFIQASNPFIKFLAKWENSIYDRAMFSPPDLLIKLIADASIVEARKPGETLFEKLETKIEGIKKLKMKDSCKIIEVDASQPISDVLYRVRKEIWSVV